MKTWRNPVIADNYEPGSTFKLMTVSTAYDLGATHAEDTYYCGGSLQVENWEIKCANTSGHGMQTLTEALMNSCNVAMMQIAQSVGMDRFYNFYKAFGLTEPTGIDLPGEGKGQFHKLDVASDWNEVALATASFGQRFTVTPIQMLNMVCAIVDDGKLKKPYVVKEVLGGDGSVKSTNETEVVRQVISEDTSAYMREAMEQVVANGTGKNAYVPGYRVGGKTATSEILPEYDSDGKVLDTEDRYTASFIGVAPMDDPQIAVLVAINDLPESATHGGGAIAAPVVGRIMEDVLPYIGITPVYDDSESDRRELTVPSVSGKTRDDAISTLSDAGFDCIIKATAIPSPIRCRMQACALRPVARLSSTWARKSRLRPLKCPICPACCRMSAAIRWRSTVCTSSRRVFRPRRSQAILPRPSRVRRPVPR